MLSEFNNECSRRRKYFRKHFPVLKMGTPIEVPDVSLNTCPVCGYYSLTIRASFDICFLCFWEDDWLAAYNPEEVSAPNRMSINEAKQEFTQFKFRFMQTAFPIDNLSFTVQKLWQEIDVLIEEDSKSATGRVSQILKQMRDLLQDKGLYSMIKLP